MWPFTKSKTPKRPSYKEINSLIDSLPKDHVESCLSGGYIDRTSNTKCYIYIGDWAKIYCIVINGYIVYKYVSGLSDRIEICDWEAVLLILEKMKLKRAEALAKLKPIT